MGAQPPTIHTGCCGFALAQAEYFRKFSCVEIDTSFYRLPKLPTAARWRAAAPAGFRFTMKAWQVITHRATSPTYRHTPLDDHDRRHCGHFGFNATIRWAWDETFAVARELDAAFVIFQCPASFAPTSEHIAGIKRFFEKAKRGKFQLGWEPRGAWKPEQVAALCKELDLVHVVDPFQMPPALTGKVQYFRLCGRTTAPHRYSGEELAQLRQFCRPSPVNYCFFNNANMVRDAAHFAALQSAC